MAKRRVEDFDPDVCAGLVPGADGVCPHRVPVGEDTGRPVIDRLAKAEGSLVKQLTGNQQYKCGKCGCNLTNLEAFDRAPEDCPRVELHDQR